MKKMYQKGSQQGMAYSTWVAVEGAVSIKRESPRKLWPPRPEAQGWAAMEREGPAPGPRLWPSRERAWGGRQPGWICLLLLLGFCRELVLARPNRKLQDR